MKKLLAMTLALAMTLSLAACSGGTSNGGGASSNPGSAGNPSGGANNGGAASGDVMHVTLITQDQMDAHWVTMESAARAKAEELKAAGKNIEFEWLAPERKDNAQQIAQIEVAVNNGANVIIVAANNATACNDALQTALDAGIKLIYVDTGATLEASATFATDNYAAGKIAGEEMLKYLSDKGLTSGEIGLVSAQAGVQSCIDRVDGFISAFDGSDFTMSEVQYSDGDAVKAQELTNALIQDGVIAVYAANNGATIGAGNAVKEANSNGKDLICVGFDNSTANRGLVRDGTIKALMAQNPDIMGEKAVEAAVTLLEGGTLSENNVDTGVSVVTVDNVDQFED